MDKKTLANSQSMKLLKLLRLSYLLHRH